MLRTNPTNIAENDSFVNSDLGLTTPNNIIPTSGNTNNDMNTQELTDIINKFGKDNILQILKEAELDASLLPTVVVEESEKYTLLNYETIDSLFIKALELTSHEKVQKTYLNWPRSLHVKLETLQKRYHHALALGFAKFLSSVVAIDDDDDEIQKCAVAEALANNNNRQNSTHCPPSRIIDVDDVFFECHENGKNPTTQIMMSKDQIASVRDAQKLTFSEIPCYDFSDNLGEVQEFCDQVLIWYSLVEEYPAIFENKTIMLQLLSKLGRNAKIAVKNAFESCGILLNGY
jgi:hypothetical protein